MSSASTNKRSQMASPVAWFTSCDAASSCDKASFLRSSCSVFSHLCNFSIIASLKTTVPCPLASKYTAMSNCDAFSWQFLTPVLALTTLARNLVAIQKVPCAFLVKVMKHYAVAISVHAAIALTTVGFSRHVDRRLARFFHVLCATLVVQLAIVRRVHNLKTKRVAKVLGHFRHL
ncbi:hypothetical protein PsorP6_001373 [Peronosclerospora sorghi]|uniref:Uncharacterized protein n=1 Tax=Peronosclerospora sorghi TaxID=230839 RepID=A0ACC0WVX6_9STRA|nr:hypothetical protein PsorP6_001373 [Peronosclerospora sorghi]